MTNDRFHRAPAAGRARPGGYDAPGSHPSPTRQQGGAGRHGPQLIVRVFLPFAAALFLSFMFRSINAPIVSDLTADLGLDVAGIGVLTSVYFLSFAAMQVPVGVWLDRHGPRRVQAALLTVAVAGALLFATSTGFVQLMLSRALIGIGLAAGFAAGIQANARWFGVHRAATVNGWLGTLGVLGALAATSPARWLVEAGGGWRALFVILAAATAACALATWVAVPDVPPAGGRPGNQEPGSITAGIKAVLGDRRFVGLAPLSAACTGTAWALQGLWAAPWLGDVEGLPQADVTRRLVVMAVAGCVAAIASGTVADRLRRRGIGAGAVLAVVAAAALAAQLALVLGWPGSLLYWQVIAVAGAAPILGFACVAEFVPKEMSGRANGVLNLFHFGGAFAVQYLIGVILRLWPSDHGHYPAAAWHLAFAIAMGLQVAALVLFVRSRRDRRAERPGSSGRTPALRTGGCETAPGP